MNRLLPFFVVFFFSAFRTFPETNPFSLKITETIDSDLAYATGATFASPYFDGRIVWKIENILDPVESIRTGPNTWSLCVKPRTETFIRFGSIAYGGLPARANNAIFSVASPFHTPLEVDERSILTAGTSRKTESAAAEIREGALRAAAFIPLPERADGITWLYCSSTWHSIAKKNADVSLSAFSGARTMPERTEDSWILDEPDMSGSLLRVTGGECIFRVGNIGGSTSILTNTGPARRIKGTGRGELYVKTGPVLASTGYCQSDREYRELDGSIPTVLSRAFAATTLTFKLGEDNRKTLQTGALLYRDLVAGDRYWHDNVERVSGGIGMNLDSDPIDVSARFMSSGESIRAEASIHADKFFVRSLSAALEGTASWPRNGQRTLSPETVETLTTLRLTAVETNRMNTRLSLGYKGTIALARTRNCGAFALEVEQAFLGSRYATTVGIEGSFDAIALKPAGSLTVSFEYR